MHYPKYILVTSVILALWTAPALPQALPDIYRNPAAIVDSLDMATASERARAVFNSVTSMAQVATDQNGNIIVPSDSKVQVTLPGYCLNTHASAPALNEPMRLEPADKFLGPVLGKVYQAVIAKAVLTGRHDDSTQAVLWFLTDFMRSSGKSGRVLNQQEVSLLLTVAPNIRATLTAMAHNFEISRSRDEGVRSIFTGLAGAFAATGGYMNPQVNAALIPLLNAGAANAAGFESIEQTTAAIAMRHSEQAIPGPSFPYSMAGPLAVQALSPGGFSAARLEIANPSGSATPFNALEYIAMSARDVQPIALQPLPSESDEPDSNCENAITNLYLVATEMAEWRDQEAELRALSAQWYSSGQRQFDNLVPQLVRDFADQANAQLGKALTQAILDSIKKDLEDAITELAKEALHASGGNPLGPLTPASLRTALHAAIENRRLFLRLSGEGLIGYAAIGYDILRNDVIPLADLVRTYYTVRDISDIENKLNVWQNDILNRYRNLMTETQQNNCQIPSDFFVQWNNARSMQQARTLLAGVSSR